MQIIDNLRTDEDKEFSKKVLSVLYNWKPEFFSPWHLLIAHAIKISIPLSSNYLYLNHIDV